MLPRNLGLKFLSLLLAIALWLYVLFTEQSPRQVAVQVVARGLGPVTALKGDLPVALVTIQGRGETGDENRITAEVDLSPQAGGSRWLPVKVRVPPQFSVLTVRPEKILVQVEPRVKRAIRLEWKLVGTPPAGLILGQPVAEPAVVQLEGPRSQVARVRHAVITLDRSLPSGDLPQVCLVQALDNAGAEVNGVRVIPALANVRVPTRQLASSQAVPVALQTNGSPAPGYQVISVSVNPAVVSLSGDKKQLEQLKQVSTEPLSLAGANRSLTAELDLLPPPGTSLLGTTRVKVHLEIKRMKAER